VHFLASNGADISATDSLFGDTALHKCYWEGHSASAIALIRNNASLSCGDKVSAVTCKVGNAHYV